MFTKLSYSKLCSSESNSSTPFETHLTSHKPHIFIVGTFVGGKMCLSCEEIPLLLLSGMRIASDLYGQNWWYYLKEGYYKNISWKDISWKDISVFFSLWKKWWMTARLHPTSSFDQNESKWMAQFESENCRMINSIFIHQSASFVHDWKRSHKYQDSSQNGRSHCARLIKCVEPSGSFRLLKVRASVRKRKRSLSFPKDQLQ